MSCCTLGRRKCVTVLPKRVVLHSRATKMLGSVTQACRATPSGDKEARKCRSSVPRCTPRRRKVWVSLPRSPLHPYVILPCTFRQRKWAEVSPESVVLHPRATKMRDSVAQACRAALLGDENVRKCCLSVPRYILERQKGAELLLKRAALHPQATESVGFVAEESHSSLRHSALHLWATKMG